MQVGEKAGPESPFFYFPDGFTAQATFSGHYFTNAFQEGKKCVAFHTDRYRWEADEMNSSAMAVLLWRLASAGTAINSMHELRTVSIPCAVSFEGIQGLV